MGNKIPGQYYIKRSIQTIILLFLILTFLFFFFRLLPGSYVDLMLYGGASEETIEQFERQWALNEPLYQQYLIYIRSFLQGDLGTSLHYRRPVTEVVGIRIFNTLILVAPAITFAYILSTFVGTVLGNARGSSLEKKGVISLITVGSFPSFFLGIVLIAIFAVWLGVFPTSGMLSTGVSNALSEAPWWRKYLTKSFGMHYFLPFLTIVLRYMYEPSIIMRTSVVEVKEEGFSYYHKITGLPYLRRVRHLGKHAILPLITLYPISMARAISGLVLVELVFNWPGIGYTLVQAVLQRDTPVVQFVFFLTAAFVVISNFVVDILYTVIDPRVRVED